MNRHKRTPRTLSLTTKLVAPLLVVGTLIGLLGSWIAYRTVLAQMDDQIYQRGLVVVNAVNRAADIAGSGEELNRFVTAIGAMQDVNLLLVVSGDPPVVIASTNEEWIGKTLSDLPYEKVQVDLYDAIEARRLHRHYHEDSKEYDFSWPLALSTKIHPRGEHSDGAIMLHLDAKPIHKEVGVATRRTIAGLLAVVAIVTLLAYMLLDRVVLKPLSGVRIAMNRRAAGDSSAYAPVQAPDEIGVVAGSLNGMLDSLVDGERRLQQAHDTLETEVQRRTNELIKTNEQLQRELTERLHAEYELRESHNRLRQADRMATIGTMAAGIAHDLNNLLLPMRSRVRVLGSTELPQRARDQLDDLRQSLDFLKGLSDSLRLCALDPEDVDATGGATELRRWWSDVQPLLEKALASRVEPRRSTLEAQLPERPMTVGVASHRLTQAILNLVVNAGDAVEGEAQVRLHIAADENPDFVSITVSDNGKGMSEAESRRAFDPFFTTKPRGASTGLGLALVQGVAQSAGGSAKIQSSPGQGASISITLPLVKSPAREQPEAVADKRVAVVCVADQRVAAYASSLLSSAGFSVVREPIESVAEASLWLTEPSDDALRLAEQFLTGERRRTVLVLGEATQPWRNLGAVAIDTTFDAEAVYAALAKAGVDSEVDQ